MLTFTMRMAMFLHLTALHGIVLSSRLDQHREQWNMLAMILQ